jgi:glycosyltransferase involved in cell wall biosynthesis
MISVLILTKNEELNLPGALASVGWSDDIHLVDSQSTDRTISIAESAGATVHQRVFDNYASQRNFGLQLPFKNEWVLILDADERPTPELSAEMQHAVRNVATEVCAFRLRRRDFFGTTWLKHAQLSPFFVRLVRPAHCHYCREINEVLKVAGPIQNLREPLNHFPFAQGIEHWIAKHNLYSTMEAQLIHNQAGLQHPSLRTACFDGDFNIRRQHQKAFFYRLPARPLIKFAYMVLFRLAVLDGIAGLTYATLQSYYEYLIVLKTRELRASAAAKVSSEIRTNTQQPLQFCPPADLGSRSRLQK